MFCPFRPLQPASHWLSGLDDAEIVVPQRLDAHGEPLHHQGALFHSRSRRSAPVQPGGELGYRLEAFGRRFDLRLTPNEDFISPNLAVHHRDGDRVWAADEDDLAVGRGCFHTGTVAGHPGSTAAVSVCDNMVRRPTTCYF